MSRDEILNKIVDSGIIAVIRMRTAERMLPVVEAIRAGGVEIIEITLTVPDALRLVSATVERLGPGVPVCVGSVLTADDAHRAVDAGAACIVSPIFKPEIILAAHERDVPVIPGCLTPTEILAAHEAGADLIKVFPADVFGMPYFKAVLAPMPFLKLMPTGGVTLDNAGDWLNTGAVTVGVGSALLNKQAIAEERYDVLTENARRLRRSVEARRVPA